MAQNVNSLQVGWLNPPGLLQEAISVTEVLCLLGHMLCLRTVNEFSWSPRDRVSHLGCQVGRYELTSSTLSKLQTVHQTIAFWTDYVEKCAKSLGLSFQDILNCDISERRWRQIAAGSLLTCSYAEGTWLLSCLPAPLQRGWTLRISNAPLLMSPPMSHGLCEILESLDAWGVRVAIRKPFSLARALRELACGAPTLYAETLNRSAAVSSLISLAQSCESGALVNACLLAASSPRREGYSTPNLMRYLRTTSSSQPVTKDRILQLSLPILAKTLAPSLLALASGRFGDPRSELIVLTTEREGPVDPSYRTYYIDGDFPQLYQKTCDAYGYLGHMRSLLASPLHRRYVIFTSERAFGRAIHDWFDKPHLFELTERERNVALAAKSLQARFCEVTDMVLVDPKIYTAALGTIVYLDLAIADNPLFEGYGRTTTTAGVITIHGHCPARSLFDMIWTQLKQREESFADIGAPGAPVVPAEDAFTNALRSDTLITYSGWL